MKYLTITFKSRNELYGFSKMLRSNGIYINIVNTPKAIGSSCLLSIKVDFLSLNKVINLLKLFNPKSFVGLYSTIETLNGNQTHRII